MDGNVLIALGLTLFAGLATGLGALVVFIAKKPDLRMLSFGLGLSGGVMVYVSLVELLPVAQEMMESGLGSGMGKWAATGCFFGGIMISALIDKLVPNPENPHEVVPLTEINRAREDDFEDAPSKARSGRKSLARVGLMSALAIGIHNFPEGIATFASSMADVSLGLSIAVAVAIHNIPEGIAVAVPVYFASKSKKKAFFYSFVSGLAEPIGALLAYALLLQFLDDTVVGAMLGTVGGIMVFISFDELLPTAREYGKGHTAIAGVVIGMAIMALSLLMI